MFLRLVFVSLFIFSSFQSLVNAHPSGDKEKKCLDYCSNEGVCVVIDLEPQCYCLPEWQGERCQFIREESPFAITEAEPMERSLARSPECLLAPPSMCLNRGLCKFENKSYTCQCPPTHIGKRCQDPSPCVGYCLNNGLCQIDANTDPSCNCNGTGFAGPQCGRRETTTTLSPANTTTDGRCLAWAEICKPGSCEVVNGSPRCRCPIGTQGEFCDTIAPVVPGQTTPPLIPGQTTPPLIPGQTNPPQAGITCAQKPCQNGRPCYNNGNTYYCYCGTQYTGVNCQTLSG